MCGGSIVTTKYVVTAAHCVYNPLQLLVIAGNKNRNSGTEHNCVNFFQHEDYDSAEFDNDVAVIELQGEFTFSNSIGAVRYYYRSHVLLKKIKAQNSIFDQNFYC